MSIGHALEFSDESLWLSSFVNLVMMLQGPNQPDNSSDWSSYLTCVSVMPGKGGKPGHPLALPLGFPPAGPPKPLPEKTAQSIEQRFATLLEFRRQIEVSIRNSGQSDPGLIEEIGPKALATIRALGSDPEVYRFASGEAYVLALKMRQEIPPDEVGNAKLIQILDDYEELRESDTPIAKRLSVRVDRLIYRLPDDRAETAFPPAQWPLWRNIGQRIERTFSQLFPNQYAVIELRNCEAATVFRGQVLGPTLQEIKRKRAEMKAKNAES